jgi:hypothetical protein
VDLNILAFVRGTACVPTNAQPNRYDEIAQLIRIRAVERMGLYRGRPYRLL